MPITTTERAYLGLLDLLRKIELEAIANREAEQITDIDRARGVVVLKLMESPHGLAYAFLHLEYSGVWPISKPSSTRSKAFERILIHKYGDPNKTRAPLTEKATLEMLAVSFEGLETWDYATKLCAAELSAGRDLPNSLKKLASIAITNNKFPHHPKIRNSARNSLILQIAEQLENRFELKKTRNSTSKKDSICSVIAEALNEYNHPIQEGAVIKILPVGPKVGKS